MTNDAISSGWRTDGGSRKEDPELLRRYVESGAEEAFTEFVRGHLDLVYFAALRRTAGNAALAGDVTQYVFTEVARKAPALARHATLAGWLYTTTRYAAAMAMRRERTRVDHEREAQRMHELMATDAVADWDRLRPVIDEALDALSGNEREAVLLRFFEGQPFAAIGQTLRISEDGARMRVERALEKLRRQLRQRGVDSTAAALSVALTEQAAFAAPPGLVVSVAGGALAAGASLAAPTAIFALAANTKIATGAMAAVAAMLMGAAIWQIGIRREAEAELARAKHRLHEVSAEARLAERGAAGAERRLAAQPSPPPNRPVEAVGSTASSLVVAEPARTEGDARRAGTEIMTRHPAVKQALVDWHVAKVNFQYASLYAELGLGSAQIAQFQELVRGTILFGDWGAKGEFLEFEAPRSVPDEHVREQLQQLLGEDGYRRYEEFRRSARAREWTAQLASQLCLSDGPLAPAQATELIRILRDTPGRRGDMASALERAAGALEPAQLAVLRGIFVAEQKWAESESVQRDVAAARMNPDK